MDYQKIKASLNLHAVLRNLSTLVACDEKAREIIKNWDLSLGFTIFKGPSLFLVFKDGACRAGEGAMEKPDIRLFFLSASHFNAMMEGRAVPIILKGFSHLHFLRRRFPKLTDRLAHFLKPQAFHFEDAEFRRINTQLNLSVAMRAVCELATQDAMGRCNASAIPEGTLAIQVLPKGPVVGLSKKGDALEVADVKPEEASAILRFRDVDVACDLVNGRCDAFAALTRGDIAMRGRIPMIEAVNLMIDRIPHYLNWP